MENSESSTMDKVLKHEENLLFKETPFKQWFYHPQGVTVQILIPTLSQDMSSSPWRIYLEKHVQFQDLLEVLRVQEGLAGSRLTYASKLVRLPDIPHNIWTGYFHPAPCSDS